ncbi:LuxR C-terminal-related transcriptional regulator [Streptomyces cyaneofuscatus]|uniref:LuxR C-terminal-related transcriptional regulator n=1 Tax=Streptomyces TaxID=1883 RepID=UPI002E130C5F|nr:LuxR C-terminal-related transcriptional regulator [Streptomyces cyaneofuscatus]WSI48973.1 LuxR C-terminal-related transcriptional regulator [Streptomyces cyaneofuscatus]WTF36994.1 LuxR C-terminal-related transcriptional regulator [Streptomyces cyaneofuscatus]
MHFVAQAPQQGAQGTSELDEFAVAFYERAIGRSEFDPLRVAEELGAPPHYAEHAVGVLRELRLVKPAESRADRLVAVSPEAAQMELLVPLEREILDSRHRLAGFKGQLSAFAAAFERQSRTRAEPVVITGDQDEIELRLLEAAQSCTTEVLVMQPCVARETRELRLARPLVLEALRRGAHGRILYPHTARGDSGTRAHLGELLPAGGQVRTTKEVSDRFLVFDRKTAFIPSGEDGEIAVVYESTVAAFLAGLHARIWESAVDFDSGAAGYAGTMEELKATLLSLLASGAKDEVIARRVGMSERTLRRHVATIMQDLSASSRFQAGVLAARTGLVDLALRSAA